jgi:hypothetical protein
MIERRVLLERRVAARVKAESLVTTGVDVPGARPVSAEARQSIVDALTLDFTADDGEPPTMKQRILQIQTQLRSLTEAVDALLVAAQRLPMCASLDGDEGGKPVR